MRLLGLVLLALTFSACSSKGPVVEPEPLKNIAEPEVIGVKLWSRSMKGAGDLTGLRPVAVAGGVFMGGTNGAISALDAQGKPLWQRSTGKRFTAGPAISGDLIVFGSRDGEVLAYSRSDGADVWAAPVSSEVLSAPVMDSQFVAVRSGDGRVYGLNAADGSRLWTQDRTVPSLTLRGTGPLLLDESAVYLGLDNGRVMALDRATGEPVWEEIVSVPTGRSEVERLVDVDADLLMVAGTLYAVSFGGDLVAVRASSGAVLWRRTMRAFTGLDYDGSCLYVTDVDSVLWCLDSTNGGAFWKQEQLKHRRLSAPRVYKGNVVVGDYEGYLHWISAAGGRIVGRSKASGKAIRIAPLVHEGQLYVIDAGGKVTVHDARPASAS